MSIKRPLLSQLALSKPAVINAFVTLLRFPAKRSAAPGSRVNLALSGNAALGPGSGSGERICDMAMLPFLTPRDTPPLSPLGLKKFSHEFPLASVIVGTPR
jgi:hypothetical protein